MARYSFSKLSEFSKCPKDYDYRYRQGLMPIEESIHLTIGKLFHGALERKSLFEDTKDIQQEWAMLVRSKRLPDHLKEGTLMRVVEEYLRYYFDEDHNDRIMFVEEKFEYLDKNMNVISGMIDKVVEKPSGDIVMTDYKTTINKLKYTEEEVSLNYQLNGYGYFLEKIYHVTPDIIRIDEIVIRDLDPVPMLASGKPARDKNKLSWVLYDDYLEECTKQGLEDDSEYQYILKMLKDRGHPLFNRVNIPYSSLKATNIVEKEWYDIIKGIESGAAYCSRSFLCKYSPYKEIQTLELIGGNEDLIKELKEIQFTIDPDVEK